MPDRRRHMARGHCSRCKTWIPFQLPLVHKRFVYLDQSFLSDVCFRSEHTAYGPVLDRLYSKLQKLKAFNKIFLIVSDIHCRETSAFPEQYAEKMGKLWQFENDLAGGKIAVNWADVFIAQHRRMLADEAPNSYPAADIGLDDAHRVQVGMNVVLTNSWRLRIHRDDTAACEKIDDRYREIIVRQVENIPSCQGVIDCLNYVRELWRNDIRLGIAAWWQRRKFLLSFEQLGPSPDAEQLASLQVPEVRAAAFLRVIDDVIRGSNGESALRRWSDLLEEDPIGPCPSLRIRSAFEAELLWTWYQGHRSNPNEFGKYFGRSQQNDIDHISAFVPYVDALTTDRNMHNLCKRKVVDDEIKRFPCKMFSVKNYDEFEKWLDELLSETNLPN